MSRKETNCRKCLTPLEKFKVIKTADENSDVSVRSLAEQLEFGGDSKEKISTLTT